MVSMMSKVDSAEKLLPLPWDKEKEKVKAIPLSKEQLETLDKWDKVKPGQGKTVSIDPLLKKAK